MPQSRPKAAETYSLLCGIRWHLARSGVGCSERSDKQTDAEFDRLAKQPALTVIGVALKLSAAAKAGQSISDLSITVFRAPPKAAALATFRAAGIDRVLFDVPDKPRDQVLPLLDQYAALIA